MLQEAFRIWRVNASIETALALSRDAAAEVTFIVETVDVNAEEPPLQTATGETTNHKSVVHDYIVDTIVNVRQTADSHVVAEVRVLAGRAIPLSNK